MFKGYTLVYVEYALGKIYISYGYAGPSSPITYEKRTYSVLDMHQRVSLEHSYADFRIRRTSNIMAQTMFIRRHTHIQTYILAIPVKKTVIEIKHGLKGENLYKKRNDWVRGTT